MDNMEIRTPSPMVWMDFPSSFDDIADNLLLWYNSGADKSNPELGSELGQKLMETVQSEIPFFNAGGKAIGASLHLACNNDMIKEVWVNAILRHIDSELEFNPLRPEKLLYYLDILMWFLPSHDLEELLRKELKEASSLKQQELVLHLIGAIDANRHSISVLEGIVPDICDSILLEIYKECKDGECGPDCKKGPCGGAILRKATDHQWEHILKPYLPFLPLHLNTEAPSETLLRRVEAMIQDAEKSWESFRQILYFTNDMATHDEAAATALLRYSAESFQPNTSRILYDCLEKDSYSWWTVLNSISHCSVESLKNIFENGQNIFALAALLAAVPTYFDEQVIEELLGKLENEKLTGTCQAGLQWIAQFCSDNQPVKILLNTILRHVKNPAVLLEGRDYRDAAPSDLELYRAETRLEWGMCTFSSEEQWQFIKTFLREHFCSNASIHLIAAAATTVRNEEIFNFCIPMLADMVYSHEIIHIIANTFILDIESGNKLIEAFAPHMESHIVDGLLELPDSTAIIALIKALAAKENEPSFSRIVESIPRFYRSRGQTLVEDTRRDQLFYTLIDTMSKEQFEIVIKVLKLKRAEANSIFAIYYNSEVGSDHVPSSDATYKLWQLWCQFREKSSCERALQISQLLQLHPSEDPIHKSLADNFLAENIHSCWRETLAEEFQSPSLELCLAAADETFKTAHLQKFLTLSRDDIKRVLPFIAKSISSDQVVQLTETHLPSLWNPRLLAYLNHDQRVALDVCIESLKEKERITNDQVETYYRSRSRCNSALRRNPSPAITDALQQIKEKKELAVQQLKSNLDEEESIFADDIPPSLKDHPVTKMENLRGLDNINYRLEVLRNIFKTFGLLESDLELEEVSLMRAYFVLYHYVTDEKDEYNNILKELHNQNITCRDELLNHIKNYE